MPDCDTVNRLLFAKPIEPVPVSPATPVMVMSPVVVSVVVRLAFRLMAPP